MSAVFPRGGSIYGGVKNFARVLGALCALGLICLPLLSQTNQGTIQGGVFDQTGGAVAGAAVSVIDVARGVTRTLTTDGAGQYIANALTPGTYTVRAEAKGFRTEEHSGVLVEVGQSVRVDLVVQPGEQTQTITVTSEVPAIDSADATLGGTVSNQSINSLPLNGRNFARLLQLRPGTVTAVGTGTGSTSTNGLPVDKDMQRLEGIANINCCQGSSLLNSSYGGGDSGSLVPIDAIQEFSSQQNPKAENGFRQGGVVNVGIKSGTNSIHGTAYAFGRDASATDAGNFFTKAIVPTPGVPPPPAVTPATMEQFGATAGGPILKDKLFWFASFEGLRVDVGDVATVTIPSSVAMTNDPTNQLSLVDACNFLNPTHAALGNAANKVNGLSAQLSGLNPVTCVVTPASSTVENLFPTLTSPTSNILAPGIPSNLPLNNGLFKGDYVLGPHQHISGFLFISKAFQTSPGSNNILPQWSHTTIDDAWQYSGDWTWSPNSTWLNDFRLGYVYYRNSQGVVDDNLIPSNPYPNGYSMNTGVTNPVYGSFPVIKFSSFSGILGGGGRTSRRGPTGGLDLVESVSYLRGKHAFKFGFEYLDQVFDGIAYSGAQGGATFTNLQSFLQGIPSSGSILLGDPTDNTRSHWFGVYAQDDWRLSPRVTLNLGLRYEYYTPETERNNYIGNFNPNVNPLNTPAIQQFGPGAPLSSEFNAGLGRVWPRLGVAWDVQGNGKTVVRAGFGVLEGGTSMAALNIISPFGANFPSINVNNTGTSINQHTPANFAFTCATASCPGTWNWNQTGAPVFPTAAPTVINGVTYTGVTCAPAAPPFNGTPCSTGAMDPNLRQPFAAEWNLDIQRAITNSLTIDVAYVGDHGYDIENMIDLNQPALGTGWNTPVAAAPFSGLTPAQLCISPASVAAGYNECSANKTVTAAVQANAAAAGQYSSIFPYLSQINESTNGDFSNYNALQVTLQGRNYHGLSFLSGYTFGHALSEKPNDADPTDTSGATILQSDKNNLRLNYGSSPNDIRHRFTFSPTYTIPGMKSPAQMLEGWSVNAIVTVQTGLRWNPSDTTSVDWLGTGEKSNTSIPVGVVQYWNYTGPTSAFSNTSQHAIPCYGVLGGCTPFASTPAATLAACQSSAQAPYAGNAALQGLALAALANAACYVQNGGVLTPPAYGTLGDAGAGVFAGPTYKNVDFSVLKLWKIKERYSAQFRLEFFNLLNRTDFSAPGSNPSSGLSGGFGYATSTPDSTNAVLGSGGPRHIQFGLKLAF